MNTFYLLRFIILYMQSFTNKETCVEVEDFLSTITIHFFFQRSQTIKPEALAHLFGSELFIIKTIWTTSGRRLVLPSDQPKN